MLDARVLQADGVEHAGRRLEHAVRRVAEARLAGGALEHDRAGVAVGETLDARVLLAEAHAAGQQHDGRGERSPQKFSRSGPLPAAVGRRRILVRHRHAGHYRTRVSRTAPAMFHVVLLQPEIPPNTGNLIRLCANTGSTLHLVKPLGFDLERQGGAPRRARLRRARAACGCTPSLAACLRGAARRARVRHRDRRAPPLQRGGVRARRCAAVRLRDTAACRRSSSPRCRPSASSRSRCAPATAASTSPTPWRWWCTRHGGRYGLAQRRLMPVANIGVFHIAEPGLVALVGLTVRNRWRCHQERRNRFS